MTPAPEWTKEDVKDLVDLIMNSNMYIKDLKNLEEF